jgi:hypothetical protein
MQEIKIEIDEQGNVQTEVSGVDGDQCLDLTKTMEQLLGGVITQREFTRDFYRQNTIEEKEKLSG